MCFDYHALTYSELVDLTTQHTNRIVRPTLDQIAKVGNVRLLNRHNTAVDSKANALGGALLIWLQKYARQKMRVVNARLDVGGLSGLKRSVIAKHAGQAIDEVVERITKRGNVDFDSMEQELFDLLRKYGLQEMQSAGGEAARGAGVRGWKLSPDIVERATDSIADKVVLIASDTDSRVRDSLKRIIREAMGEQPTPSLRDVARRIARSWFGPSTETLTGRGTTEEGRVTADWRRTQADIDEGGREYLFSFSRASIIARNEIANVRLEATAEAYADCGVKTVGWMSYGNDGRSGPRKHYLMNRKTITVEDMQASDKSRWFELPNGERTPYPKWFGLSAYNSVNCRCGLRANN